tara:strand:+ start:200 stop:418 length:219 start_codon:yes stop_codon:yes gene_type:complete
MISAPLSATMGACANLKFLGDAKVRYPARFGAGASNLLVSRAFEVVIAKKTVRHVSHREILIVEVLVKSMDI